METEEPKTKQETIRAHVTITGYVQGVFFRETCIKEALDLGVTGWVKNTEEGGVEAVFEGEENLVKEMILWCKDGPRLSRVENVDVEYEEPTGEFNSFQRLN